MSSWALANLSDPASRLNKMLAIGNFTGVGNLLLEELMTLSHSALSMENKRSLAKLVSHFVTEKFDISSELVFGMPHRDENLPHHLHGNWEKDVFPQMIIFCYVLGATWKTLPTPHDKLVPYYTMMAEKQEQMIRTAIEQHQQWQKINAKRTEQKQAQQMQIEQRQIQLRFEELAQPILDEMNENIAHVQASNKDHYLKQAEIAHVKEHFQRRLDQLREELS